VTSVQPQTPENTGQDDMAYFSGLFYHVLACNLGYSFTSIQSHISLTKKEVVLGKKKLQNVWQPKEFEFPHQCLVETLNTIAPLTSKKNALEVIEDEQLIKPNIFL